MRSASLQSGPELSVVVPVYNERENLAPLLEELLAVVTDCAHSFEIVFVDDGSSDDSAAYLAARSASERRIRLVRLSRNFGHQAALVAGLEAARGELIVTMDGDLQHPPRLIREMIGQRRDGAEIVQAVRREPADGSPLKRTGSRFFYRLLSTLARIRVTPGAADFRLMTRAALDAFLQCRERARFNRGLVQWIGFDYREVPYDAAPRRSGRSKYSIRAMMRLAGDAIFSFSTAPLRLAGLAGIAVSLAAAAYLLFALWARLFTERTEPGWTSILATVLVIGGVQLIGLWILGEYIGRLYEEAKQRPLYIARRDPRRSGEQQAADAESTQDEASMHAR
jgi:glycosyltransferase involved in cell wall biosynthesis